jgi:DNA-binding MarR family transcriptional regulator
MSDSITFSGDQKAKLTQLVNEGMQVMREVETLNEGLRDTVKAVAEELQIKPSILNKAIKIAHKADFTREQQDHQLLEDILSTVGHTL